MTSQWTAPKTWVSEPLTSSDLNTHLRDNLEFLKTPPTALYTPQESSDYTTASTTFTDVDSTNLKLSITTAGGTVLIAFYGVITLNTTGSIFLDVLHNSTSRLGGADGLTLANLPVTASQAIPISFFHLKTGLSAGTHEFRLQWKVTAGTGTLFAGAGSVNRDIYSQFWVREL